MRFLRGETISVLVCDGSAGQWLDNAGALRMVQGTLDDSLRDALAALWDAARTRPPAEGGPFRAPGEVEDRPRRCPFCAGALEKNRVLGPEVVVDACPAHGVFLDARELRVLELFFVLRGLGG